MKTRLVIADTFEYSKEFKDLIVRLHSGLETCPNYDNYLKAHLGGPDSRLIAYMNHLCPEIQYHCGNLKSKRVMDFGCGTGSTTAALAEYCDRVYAFDRDAERVEICKARIHEHGSDERVQFFCADDIELVRQTIGHFDVILVNGVIEHIPMSKTGLRRRILRSLFDLLNAGGCLFISDTPNRLYPFDSHTTQLWWIPWTSPGSEWAYKKAVRKARHLASPTVSEGALALEESGAWGATYWEIASCLPRRSFVCVNLEVGHNRHVQYMVPATMKLAAFELAAYYVGVRLLHMPMTAFTPYITNLIFKKK